MKILAIETSCDETAISIVEAKGRKTSPEFSILSDQTISQVKIHEKWGGVVPNLAKREHAKNLLPILKNSLNEAGLLKSAPQKIDGTTKEKIKNLLQREESLAEELLVFFSKYKTPSINHIAVTYGPGLEPALWVGINFAKALSLVWEKPLIPINHMEGHILSVLIEKKDHSYRTQKIKYPALSLLISGGHTELVLSQAPFVYKIIGATRDDAAGEAFDKVARILGLPYPGGPQISNLAKSAACENNFNIPRPMINSSDYDFSFSGLKTSVLYKVQKLGELSLPQRADLANQFEEAVTDVLLTKTMRAIEEFKIKTLIIGGGVSANERIRHAFTKAIKENHKEVTLLIPEQKFSTDNAVMIALSAFLRIKEKKTYNEKEVLATGNLTLN